MFFTREWEKNNKKYFQSVEIKNDILIYINIKSVFQMEIDYTHFLAAEDDAYLGWSWSKILLFRTKELIFCNSKHFLQKTMTPCYSCHFWIFYIFNLFQIIMLSLFHAYYDQYSIMFKDSNVFEFTNFPFKQNIIILQFTLLIAIVYS